LRRAPNGLMPMLMRSWSFRVGKTVMSISQLINFSKKLNHMSELIARQKERETLNNELTDIMI
jgi:hypothetical protein